jgi:hypothetical protein
MSHCQLVPRRHLMASHHYHHHYHVPYHLLHRSKPQVVSLPTPLVGHRLYHLRRLQPVMPAVWAMKMTKTMTRIVI